MNSSNPSSSPIRTDRGCNTITTNYQYNHNQLSILTILPTHIPISNYHFVSRSTSIAINKYRESFQISEGFQCTYNISYLPAEAFFLASTSEISYQTLLSFLRKNLPPYPFTVLTRSYLVRYAGKSRDSEWQKTKDDAFYLH